MSGPQLLDSLTELPRTVIEVGLLTGHWAGLVRNAPSGEPHPVMVLPGFLGGDDSTLLLRRFLTRLNYKSFPWLQGTNTGNPRQLEEAVLRFYRLHHATGRKITLIGQSLGGVYAREIARQFPDAVRLVITLGSPYRATKSGSTSPVVEKLFERMSGMTVEEMRAQVPQAEEHQHLPMPATSIYSKADGVVHWTTCIEDETDISENIRVWGSHSGMAMNPDVLRIVADRLAQDPNNWQRFKPSRCYRLLYPDS